MTDEELKQIEERLDYRTRHEYKRNCLWPDITTLLASYKERDAEVKRLEKMADRATNSTGEQAYEQGRDDGYREGLEDGRDQ